MTQHQAHTGQQVAPVAHKGCLPAAATNILPTLFLFTTGAGSTTGNLQVRTQVPGGLLMHAPGVQ